MDEPNQGAPGCPVYNWPMADAVANAVALSQGGRYYIILNLEVLYLFLLFSVVLFRHKMGPGTLVIR